MGQGMAPGGVVWRLALGGTLRLRGHSRTCNHSAWGPVRRTSDTSLCRHEGRTLQKMVLLTLLARGFMQHRCLGKNKRF